MGSVSMSEAEMACRHLQRLACEYVTGPGARQPRHDHRIDSVLLINCFFRADNFRIRRSAGGIMAAGHVDFDVAEVNMTGGYDPTRRKSSFATARPGRIVFP